MEKAKVFVVVGTYDGCCSQDSILVVELDLNIAKKSLDMLKKLKEYDEYELQEWNTGKVLNKYTTDEYFEKYKNRLKKTAALKNINNSK